MDCNASDGTINNLINLEQLYEKASKMRAKGHRESAEMLFKELHHRAPHNGVFLLHLCEILLEQQKLSDAKIALKNYESASNLNTEADYYFRLATALMHSAKGETSEAIKIYRVGLKDLPNDTKILYALGEALIKQGRILEAEHTFSRCVNLSCSEKHVQKLALLHINNKANRKAIKTLELIEFQSLPTDMAILLIDTHLAEGNITQADKLFTSRSGEAVNSAQWKYLQARLKLCLGDLISYTQIIDKLVYKNSNNEISCETEVIYGLLQIGNMKEGKRRIREALKEQSYNPQIRLMNAQNLIREQKYLEGWKEYEHRLSFSTQMHFNLKPTWDGSDLDNKNILIIGEQGVGEMIAFSRFLKTIQESAKSIHVICEKKIADLLEGSYPSIKFLTTVTDLDLIPENHIRIAIGSLPYYLTQNKNQFNKLLKAKTLTIRKHDQNLWKLRLEKLSRYSQHSFKIGISLEGGRREDGVTSLPRRVTHDDIFRCFVGLKVIFIDIQYKGNHQAISQSANNYGFECNDFTNICDDLQQLSALLINLDMIITTQQTNAHLAGALNLPAITILPPCCNFFFGTAEQSLWYPSLKLLRAKKFQQWEFLKQQLPTTIQDLIKNNIQ